MNPFLGVVFHWLGGLASGSFYVPYRGVKKWSWETYWLVGGVFSWIICPGAIAYFMTSDLVGVIRQQSAGTLGWTYLFGALWGFGGLTFGLTMRYLGMSLGMGMALGYCAALGTLLPPIFKAIMPDLPVGSSIVEIARSGPGRITLIGVAICMIGIYIASLAGWTKEKEMPEEQKKKAIKEFNFKKGILVATFSGIMSACFAFALQAGNNIRVDSLKAGFINSAAEKGIHMVDKGALSNDATAQFVANLEPGALGLNPDKKMDFSSVVEEIETNNLVAAKFASAYSGSTNSVGQRLAAFAAGLPAIKNNGAAMSTIINLEDFSQKEIALGIATMGGDIAAMEKRYGLWQGLPPLVIALLGGFTTNFIWCLILNIKNKTGYQYLASHVRAEHAHHGGLGSGEHGPGEMAAALASNDFKIPVFNNYLFSALAGTCWYFQFFFYTMGATQMGKYDFASWTLHMASIIIFSTMWGWILHEWKGSSKKAHGLIAAGIATLILSTIIIGFGTYLKGQH